MAAIPTITRGDGFPRLTMTTGTNNKEWSCVVSSSGDYTVSYGKIGNPMALNHSGSKKFGTFEEAMKKANKTYKEKIKKGYVPDVGGDGAKATPSPSSGGGRDDDGVDLDCPICTERFCSENTGKKIFQCAEGHLICETCKGRLTASYDSDDDEYDEYDDGPTPKCPSCRGELGNIRNRALEKMAQDTSDSTNPVPASKKRPAEVLAPMKTTSRNVSARTSSGPVSASARGTARSKLQIAINFDTTGSMYSCLHAVKGKITTLLPRIQEKFDGTVEFRISANGDYQDEHATYLFTCMPGFTSSVSVCNSFVQSTGRTCGYDAKEAYEYALRQISNYHDWDEHSSKVVIFIADDLPHPKGWFRQKEPIDWKQECKRMAARDIQIYPIQCLSRSYATQFYKGMADLSGGVHLELDQFRELDQVLLAIACQKQSSDALSLYRDELTELRQLNRSLMLTINRLEGKSDDILPRADPDAVAAGTFQVMHVDTSKKWVVKDFMLTNGVPWSKDEEFYYEFKKASEKIQPKKLVVLQHKRTGDMFSGSRARELIGVSPNGTNGVETVRLKDLPEDYRVFVQSTSVNRVLVPDSEFLYKRREDDSTTGAA